MTLSVIFFFPGFLRTLSLEQIWSASFCLFLSRGLQRPLVPEVVCELNEKDLKPWEEEEGEGAPSVLFPCGRRRRKRKGTRETPTGEGEKGSLLPPSLGRRAVLKVLVRKEEEGRGSGKKRSPEQVVGGEREEGSGGWLYIPSPPPKSFYSAVRLETRG